MDINSLEQSFKELEQYSTAQFNTIESLQKELSRLQEENTSLKKIIDGNFPKLEFNPGNLGISNEQLICETQIHFLKEQAVTRQLNADEARRFAIFVDVLEKIKKTKSDEDLNLEKLSDEELLKVVVNNVGK